MELPEAQPYPLDYIEIDNLIHQSYAGSSGIITCQKCGNICIEYSHMLNSTICKQCLQEELDMLEQDDEE